MKFPFCTLRLSFKALFALLDAVANDWLHGECFFALLAQRLGCRIGQTAASSKDTPVIRRVVENILVQRGKLQLAAVKQRLQFLKRDHAVHIGRDAGTPQLGFFAVQGPINTTLAVGSPCLMARPISAMGERLCDTYGSSAGNAVSI